MNDDKIQLKDVANTNVVIWPNKFVKIYLKDYLAGQENENQILNIKAQSSSKDLGTNTCAISLPDCIDLPQTASVPAKLELCIGVRVMLTDVVVNGSIGRGKHLDMGSKPLFSTIYVKFDDSKAGNSKKTWR